MEPIFGPYEPSVRSIVMIAGDGITDELISGAGIFSMMELDHVQKTRLFEIISDPNHPWIIEHLKGLDQFYRSDSIRNDSFGKNATLGQIIGMGLLAVGAILIALMLLYFI